MAMLRVSRELLMRRLFKDINIDPKPELIDIKHLDAHVLLLYIEGDGLPPGDDEVQALITKTSASVTFIPVTPKP